MDIHDNGDPGQSKTRDLQTCASKTACEALQLSIGLYYQHQHGPMIHSQLFIFDRIIFKHLNSFGRKVIIVSENVFQQKNMKSEGLWLNYRNNNRAFHYSNAHSNVSHSRQNIQLLSSCD